MRDVTRVNLDAHDRPPESKGMNPAKLTLMIGQPPAACDVTRFQDFLGIEIGAHFGDDFR